MWVGGQRHAPVALPPGKNRYPSHRRLSEPQARSGQVPKISPPPEFDPRTVQPVPSHYTDCAVPAHSIFCLLILYFIQGSTINLENGRWLQDAHRRHKLYN